MTDTRPVLFDFDAEQSPPAADLPEVVDARTDEELDEELDELAHDVPHELPNDPRLVETRAMDIVEIAVEVTAAPDPEVEVVARGGSSGDEPAVGPGAGESAGEVAVDPRMQERREQVDADRRRSRWRRVAAAAGVVVAVGAVFALLQSPLLDVDRVEIVGSGLVGEADIARISGLRVGDPMVFVDPGAVRAALAKDPRFVRVVVQRRFPSTVSVRLTDRRAIAVVVGPTRGVVVGEGGVIIAKARGDEFIQHVQVPKDPPTRVGARLPAALADAVDVMGSLSYEIAGRIVAMRITPEGELVFDLGEERSVLFGTVEDAERKLLAIRTMLGPQVDTSGLCQLDVRVPNAPTIRRDPDCDPPPPPPAPEPAVDPAAPAATAPAADPAAAAPPDPAPTVAAPPDTAPPDTAPPPAMSPSDPGADPAGALAPEPNAPVTVPAG